MAAHTWLLSVTQDYSAAGGSGKAGGGGGFVTAAVLPRGCLKGPSLL